MTTWLHVYKTALSAWSPHYARDNFKDLLGKVQKIYNNIHRTKGCRNCAESMSLFCHLAAN